MTATRRPLAAAAPYTMLLLVLLSALISSTAALSCAAQWQCSPVTTDYNYVSCTSGSCMCLTSHGFSGNATTQNPCACPPPGSVYWVGSQPYCIDVVGTTAALARTEILKSQVRVVYDSLIYPTPYFVLNGSVSLDGVFGPSAKGRVDPFGVFNTRQVLEEYYYVFAATPVNRVVQVTYIDLFGVGDEVFVRVDISFQSFIDGSITNATESGRYLFDDNNLIVSADLIAHNIGKLADPSVDANPQGTIEFLCGQIVTSPGLCNSGNDPLGYYTSVADCISFMNSITFGTYDEAAANSVVCRVLHNTLVPYAPGIHCPHVGKTGGTACVDTPYSSYYLVSY